MPVTRLRHRYDLLGQLDPLFTKTVSTKSARRLRDRVLHAKDLFAMMYHVLGVSNQTGKMGHFAR